MSVKPSDEGKPFVQGVVDGSCDLPISYSGFKIVKPSFDDGKHQCSIDILPLLFEETALPGSLKYPLDSSHARDVYSISVLPQESNNLQCPSQLAFLRFLEVPTQAKDQVCTDTEFNCQNCIDLEIDGSDTFSSCVVDDDMEKDSLQVPESDEKAIESLKCENVLNNMQRVLRRQASVNLGAKFIQLLMTCGTTTPRDKIGTERIHDIPNINHWRRYKRAASFDSRKIVLLFSILSIFGTLVLIYLTLRVRHQTVDVIIHV